MKKLIRIIGVVLVVLGIGVGAYLVYDNIQKDKQEKEFSDSDHIDRRGSHHSYWRSRWFLLGLGKYCFRGKTK